MSATAQVVGICRAKPVSLSPLDVLEEGKGGAAIGATLSQLKKMQDECGGVSLPAQLDLRQELKDTKLSFELAQLLSTRSRVMDELAALTPHACPGTPTQAALVRSEAVLRRRLQELSHDLSDASLQQVRG
jgi:hypothetical protein